MSKLSSHIPSGIITLRPLTLKGNNIIKNHGSRWSVSRFDKDTNRILVNSVDGKFNSRWIKLVNDPNFKIEKENDATFLKRMFGDETLGSI